MIVYINDPEKLQELKAPKKYKSESEFEQALLQQFKNWF